MMDQDSLQRTLLVLTHTALWGRYYYSHPVYRWGDKSTEKSNNFLPDTHLGGKESGFKPRQSDSRGSYKVPRRILVRSWAVTLLGFPVQLWTQLAVVPGTQLLDSTQLPKLSPQTFSIQFLAPSSQQDTPALAPLAWQLSSCLNLGPCLCSIPHLYLLHPGLPYSSPHQPAWGSAHLHTGPGT
jgi:hypothetical protein